ncbi:MAG: hypothetical protein Q8K92_12955 [Leadbetterella sp.]|nr:hypothetical protein [Leadbetterella sp.]
MNGEEFKTIIEGSIAQGYTTESIQLLTSFLSDDSQFESSIQVDVVLLSNQYFDLQNKEDLGLIIGTEQKNRIIFAVLNLLHTAIDCLPAPHEYFLSEQLKDEVEQLSLEIKKRNRRKKLVRVGVVTGGISGLIIIALVGTNIILMILAGVAVIAGLFFVHDKV